LSAGSGSVFSVYNNGAGVGEYIGDSTTPPYGQAQLEMHSTGGTTHIEIDEGGAGRVFGVDAGGGLYARSVSTIGGIPIGVGAATGISADGGAGLGNIYVRTSGVLNIKNENGTSTWATIGPTGVSVV